LYKLASICSFAFVELHYNNNELIPGKEVFIFVFGWVRPNKEKRGGKIKATVPFLYLVDRPFKVVVVSTAPSSSK